MPYRTTGIDGGELRSYGGVQFEHLASDFLRHPGGSARRIKHNAVGA